MRKATHLGHCQLCGREHKLPGTATRVAKHGYSVLWNQFVGECPGSNGRPIEESCDLIERHYFFVLRNIEGLEIEAAKEEKRTDGVWVREYRPATWENRRSANVWRFLKAGEFELAYYGVEYRNSATGRLNTESISYKVEHVAWTAHLNAKRGDALRKEAADLRTYAEWLAKRLANWKPAPLVSIEKVAA